MLTRRASHPDCVPSLPELRYQSSQVGGCLNLVLRVSEFRVCEKRFTEHFTRSTPVYQCPTIDQIGR